MRDIFFFIIQLNTEKVHTNKETAPTAAPQTTSPKNIRVSVSGHWTHTSTSLLSSIASRSQERTHNCFSLLILQTIPPLFFYNLYSTSWRVHRSLTNNNKKATTTAPTISGNRIQIEKIAQQIINTRNKRTFAVRQHTLVYKHAKTENR